MLRLLFRTVLHMVRLWYLLQLGAVATRAAAAGDSMRDALPSATDTVAVIVSGSDGGSVRKRFLASF
jgi:hypothetical protein